MDDLSKQDLLIEARNRDLEVKGNETKEAIKEKLRAQGFTDQSWGGQRHFSCNFCAFDTFVGPEAVDHVNDNHLQRLVESD